MSKLTHLLRQKNGLLSCLSCSIHQPFLQTIPLNKFPFQILKGGSDINFKTFSSITIYKNASIPGRVGNTILSTHMNFSNLRRRNIMDKEFFCSNSKSSTGGTVAVNEDDVKPGTTVCFQFWITNDLLNKMAVRSYPQPHRLFQNTNYIPTVRKYEYINEDCDGSSSEMADAFVRIMSYNVLSQSLLEQHNHLYRDQSQNVLAWSYRSKIILSEILATKPDVVCLQEVEESHIPSFYKKLSNYGYNMVFKMKTGQRHDGLAVFYKISVIKLLKTETVEFKQPGVVQLASRDNVGLILKLEKGGKKFIVANTHLLFNPKRTEVRLAQMQMFLAEIGKLARENSNQVGVLLMGDMNSLPSSPLITLLNQGKLVSQYKSLPLCLGVSTDCEHIEHESKLYHSEKQHEDPCTGKGLSIVPDIGNQSNIISHNFNFTSVYNLNEDSKRGVTTFQEKWVLVDYMFYSSGIKLLSRLTLPTPEECDSFVHFLPNSVNPSDHLPLVADFIIS